MDENTSFEKAMDALQTHVIVEYLTTGVLYDPIRDYAEKSSWILKNAEKKLSVSADSLSKYGLTSASKIQARKKQEA
jgi:hypothetical protein